MLPPALAAEVEDTTSNSSNELSDLSLFNSFQEIGKSISVIDHWHI